MSEKRKIIVVDDNIDLGKITKEILSRIGGYFVIYCDSAASALSKIQYEFIPNLVITDLQMPIMNGLELTAILKEKIPDLPVIILTGRPGLVPKDSPADLVIEKPYLVEQLLEKVKKLI
ncbi:response regulator [Patescibacteria group bacterium]|nr:response regulator [Patescibacteria group bacterium]MBU2579610.1 response regulator [Patescibacteria group bacterium]MBU4030729.1 response regulator [Patescibacteria group bacterium]MBU4082796.1 response regulator [Patescibacteria group bacterium]MCG2809323.1 response regulator [Candidatus Portnoybacteria bacterium]